jgi:hypothetical protein
VNKRLTELIEKWQYAGCHPQEAFDWSSVRPNWKKKFPEHSDFLESVLPSSIDRVTVRAVCQSSQYDIVEKFLTVMVWGYGDRGYGPYRVEVMLSQPHAKGILSEARELAVSGNPKEAYIHLMHNRIRMLGPSFGTKFLSFCTPREIGAPIYDSLVSLWVSNHASTDFCHVSTNAENWNSKTYLAYWDWIKVHADNFQCFPDDVELVVFRDAEDQYSSNSGWANK